MYYVIHAGATTHQKSKFSLSETPKRTEQKKIARRTPRLVTLVAVMDGMRLREVRKVRGVYVVARLFSCCVTTEWFGQ